MIAVAFLSSLLDSTLDSTRETIVVPGMCCVLVDLLFSLLLLHRRELHGVMDATLSSDQEYYPREEQLQNNLSRLGCEALCACRSALFTTFVT